MTVSQFGLVKLCRVALTANLRVVRLQQCLGVSGVWVMAFYATFALYWSVSQVSVFLKRVVTRRTNSALVVYQRERIACVRRDVTIRAGGTFHRGMNRIWQQRSIFGGMRNVALRAIFVADGITRMLLGKRRIILAVTACAELIRRLRQ